MHKPPYFMQTRRTSFSSFAKTFCVFAAAALTWCNTGQAALVAYWNFDEASGTNILDTAGNAVINNGFYATAAEAPARVPGRLGGALGFTWSGAPGSGGKRVVVPYHTNLSLNGPFTISYWYRMDAATPAGTFPGIMRLGTSQSATTGNNVGWGFFRTGNMVYKRGNSQPGGFPAMAVGQWYHVALRFDGNLTGNNNIAFLNGQQINIATAGGWSNVTTTLNFELGRMDQFDTATLDDLALWNSEAVAPARIRSLYTVPTSLALDYNLADMRVLWSVFDGGPGTSNTVKGMTWSYAPSVPGSQTAGEAYLSGGTFYVVLAAGMGVSSPLRHVTGTISPLGIGTVGTLPLAGDPAITFSNANAVFDLNAATTVGGGVNDLFDITGDLNIINSTVSIDPLAPLPGGTYRLFNYSGIKTGSPTVLNTTRYTLALDEMTAGEINLTVSGSAGAVKWNSATSGTWDLATANWLNVDTSASDRFFQGDSVVFDDSGAFQTNITVTTPVFPRSIAVNSAARNYAITGTALIGGVADGLTKAGASMLTLATPNTFSGNVQVNEGTLRLGNASALGDTNTGTAVATGATLDLGGFSPGLEPVVVGGSGVAGAGAVINTGAALSNNGLRGRVTLTGDTTFGGVNRWDVIGGTIVGNNFRLTKVGTPEIALSNLGDTGLGAVDVMQGILTVLGNTRMGDPTQPITINTNAILAFWDNGATVLDKPVVINSAIMRNNTSPATAVATNLGAITLNGDATFQINANITLLGAVGGSGNLIKVNTGTLYLGGANTYSGRTTIAAGRLALLSGGTLAGTPRIDVQPGAVFDVTRLGSGYTVASGQTVSGSGSVHGSLNVPAGGNVLVGTENVGGTLTVTNQLDLSGGTLQYDIAAATIEGAGVNDLINVGGNLVLGGTTVINVNPIALLTVGNTYTLINYTGALTGTEANFTVATSSRYTFAVSVATAGKVTLTVTGGAAEDLIWLGGQFGAENVWDLQTTLNWSDPLGNPVGFFGGDKVTFDDFGLTNIIDLVGALTPASIRVDNGTLDYVFQGSGKLSGNSSLTKTFGAKLSIVNSAVNDFVGPVTVGAGILEVGNGATSGNLGSGSITISNSATVVYNRSDALTLANSLSGSGSLVKLNNNSLALNGSNTNFDGTLTMNGGALRPGNTNALGTAAGGTVIAAGAALDLNNLNLGAEPVTVAGSGINNAGAIFNNGGGQNNALRFVTLAGDTTVGGTGRWDIRANPSGSLSTGGNAYNLTKVGNNQFSLVDLVVDPALGDINVNSGTFAVEVGSGAGDPTKTITVANNATLLFWARSVPWNKVHVLNGGRNILNGNGNTIMSGPVTLNGAVTFETAANTSLTVTDVIAGNGSLTKTVGGTLALGGDNTYSGSTTVSAGVLQLGTGTNAGWVTGPIVVGGNTLTVYRSDTVTVSNTLTGTGTLNVRTPNGLVLGNNTVNFATINVGLTTPGRLVLQPGFTGTLGALSVGDSPGGAYGELFQNGGTVTVSGLCRIGHWPNATSTYVMGGGTLAVTATPGGTVNLGGQPEQPGVIYLGVDGTGVFIQTGGVARAHGVVFDGRGNTVGDDTFTLAGGQFIVGPSGFKSGALDANTSYNINLGGGTLTSSANWNSVLRMNLTGVNGDVVLDTAAFSNVLSGALSGAGGLAKAGSGTLALTGAGSYEGATAVSAGTLLVRGSLTGPVVVSGGTLAGDGTLNGPLTVAAGATLAPGLSIGAITANSAVSLGGNTVMEIAKAGTTLTSDRVAGSGAITYGGTLTVVASGDVLANGDTFDLFDGSSFSGSFASLVLPALPSGLFWDLSQLAVNGTIRVSPPRLTLGVNGSSITINWPGEAADYTLQAQTNAPGVGLNNTNWVSLNPGTNSVTFQVDTNHGSVFYRLLKP